MIFPDLQICRLGALVIVPGGWITGLVCAVGAVALVGLTLRGFDEGVAYYWIARCAYKDKNPRRFWFLIVANIVCVVILSGIAVLGLLSFFDPKPLLSGNQALGLICAVTTVIMSYQTYNGYKQGFAYYLHSDVVRRDEHPFWFWFVLALTILILAYFAILAFVGLSGYLFG